MSKAIVFPHVNWEGIPLLENAEDTVKTQMYGSVLTCFRAVLTKK
ncbi:hypothetical protein [Brevibacillus laterosporus]|uniref:Uncharacterized protein n=1 Tax=Brevibacillus laterosporus LMG 15441 TaxID=1042163 RepID=A0A075RI49_BRELA|nr:hypothetical protein [Brevibacillus laterosporus]AIG28820.1 hypothetical protein BRLA_c045560 [Brevibacillus laterosporus LMG 15441]